MKSNVLAFIQKISVRGLIVLIFTVEILFFVILTGYLSYSSSLHKIRESANQVSAIANDEITKMVMNYLEDPDQLEQIHKSVMLNHQIDFSDQVQRDKHFVEILKVFPWVTNTYVTLIDGNEYGARREDDGNFVVWNSDIEKKTLDYYKYDDQFGRQGYIKSLFSYDSRQRPPYLKGIEMKKPGWTDVYDSATGRGLVITEVYPIYTSDNQLVGVLGSSLLLNWMDEFLKSLSVTEHSSIFIIAKNEELVAATDKTSPLFLEGIRALKSTAPLLSAINTDVALNFNFNGENFLLHAHPVQGKNNLQWISMILIPEKDLTHPMNDFMDELMIITIISCLLGIITGVLAARYIINPIIKVNQLAKKIAEGDFSTKIEMHRDDEIGQLVHTVNEMSTKLENQFESEKAAKEMEIRLNRATRRFVPHEFLGSLHKNSIMEIEPGDHVDKELTVFFTDIRSYTKIAETMSSVEIFNFINRYLSIAVKVIVKNNGFIDKFIGDAIMGLFSESPDDALLAVIELFEELKQYNSQPGVIPIHIGAGIHYGAVTMGTVGTEQRMDTTVIGDAVNFAARLENATKIYGKSVLISEAVYVKLKNPDRFNIREIDTVKVKGKSVPIKIYEVFDFDDSMLKAGKISTAKLFSEGLLLYKAGSFAEADLKFKECKEICPGDELLAIYIKRCATLRRIPPGEDWCGVSGI